MKSLAVRLSLLVLVLFFVVFAAPSIASAQDEKVRPVPESPPSEPPRNDPPPSPPPPPPAEAPRNDPPPSPPAEAPRNDSPPSPRTESPRPDPPSRPEPPRSDPPPNPPSPRAETPRPDPPSTPEPPRSEPAPNPPSGSGNSNNRSGNIAPPTTNNQGGAGVRGAMSGDGSGNRRDRVVETESGDIVPARAGGRTPGNVTPGGTSGPNRGGNVAGGANPGGNPGRHRDRDRDRDGGRWRDRHRGGRGHRHYRGDECYQVPAYDDTVSYVAASYPDYDPDDSLSAYDRGYKDGIYTGANDGRRGQTYDPERSHFYKSGTAGYRSSKGSRDVYRQAYRDGFLRGYREGYENWQKYFVGGVFRK